MCRIVANSTAVAPISLADLAKGWNLDVTKSTTFSIAEFINSTISINIKVITRINLYKIGVAVDILWV